MNPKNFQRIFKSNAGRTCLRAIPLLLAVMLISAAQPAEELSLNQKLIVACYRLDVQGVVQALRAGADVNARFGQGDRHIFMDKWTFGSPKDAAAWTPLIALASSLPYPDPPREIQNTQADRMWAMEQLNKFPKEQLERRNRDCLMILNILLSHKCDLDAADFHGATALYEAVYGQKEEMAKILINYGAKVNTRTGIYIDGDGDITPLHRVFWSKELTKLLLEKGADPQAKTTDGQTPLDWAKRHGDPEVIKLYQSPTSAPTSQP